MPRWTTSGARRLAALLAALSILSLLLGACAPSDPPVAPRPTAGLATPTRASAVFRPTSTAAPAAPPATASAAITPTPTPAPTLQGALDQIVAASPANVGVYVQSLRSGQTAAIRPDDQFRSASLYKLFVLYSTYAELQSGRASPEETLTLSHAAYTVDPYNEWPEGTTTSLSCALQAMITVSSNSASEMLIERVGGLERINADLQRLGLTHSSVSDVYAYTSPRDVARLLDLIFTKRAVSPSASNAMLQLLLDQRRNDRLPMVLPPGIEVAHKTGELDHLRNDAGIVYGPTGPYLFVALVGDAPTDGAARDTVQGLARTAWDYFVPGGTATYDGLPPRLAAEVFQVPDSDGRLAPIDEWNEVVPVAGSGVGLTKAARDVQLQEAALPDLFALQQASAAARATFWVADGYHPPRAIDAPDVVRTDALDCTVHLPPPPTPTPGAIDDSTDLPATPTAGPTPTPALPPHASQQWLGTVVRLSDRYDGDPSDDFATSTTGRWLFEHAWQYGFIPALPETSAGAPLGYEPWELRWVGRDLAAQIHQQDPTFSHSAVAFAAFSRAEADLAQQAQRNRAQTVQGK